MTRVAVASLIAGAAFLVIVLDAGAGLGVAEHLMILAIVVVTGIGPFAFGAVVRLLWKSDDVPQALPWLFAVALGLIRYVAPQFGGLTVWASKPISVLMTIALGGAFAELGIASATAMLRRRVLRDSASSES